MAYDKSKDLAKRTQSDKVLKDKALRVIQNMVAIKDDGYQRGLASMVCNFFDKKYSRSGIINEPNYQLADELDKPNIKKFKKEKFIHH